MSNDVFRHFGKVAARTRGSPKVVHIAARPRFNSPTNGIADLEESYCIIFPWPCVVVNEMEMYVFNMNNSRNWTESRVRSRCFLAMLRVAQSLERKNHQSGSTKRPEKDENDLSSTSCTLGYMENIVVVIYLYGPL